MMEHDAIKDLLEPYALGALEASDRERVDAHIRSGCDDCAATLRSLLDTAADMALAAPQHEPPARLKSQILARAGEAVSTDSPRRGGSTVSWIITAVAVAAVIVLAFRTNTLKDEVAHLQDALAEAEDVTDLLNAPGMQFVDLKGVEPNTQAFGKVVVDPERGEAVVYMYRLPQTPEGMEYQLWIMRDGKPTSAGLFTVNPDGTAMIALNDFLESPDSASFLVTIEPQGGESVPTGMMYLTGPDRPTTGEQH